MRAAALAVAAAVLAGGAAVIAPRPAAPLSATVRADSVYTLKQAARGRKVIAERCVRCHGPQLEGAVGPALVADRFRCRWLTGERPLLDLWRVVNSMPYDDPGSLSRKQYLDAIAYLLQENGVPAGKRELEADEKRLDRLRPAAPRVCS